MKGHAVRHATGQSKHNADQSRLSKAEQYDILQATACEELDLLFEQVEETLTSKEFDVARAALNTAYFTVGTLTALYRRRRGAARKELRRLVLLYALNQRALAGAVSAIKREHAGPIILANSQVEITQRIQDYPDSPEFKALAEKIQSWQLLLDPR